MAAFTFKHGDRPLDGYAIQRGVGRGGFGEVYFAVSDGGKEVALKYLRENPQVELRGVAHCLNLKSPRLVSLFDVRQSAAGEHFIVMEYVSGPSLRDLLIAEPDGLGVEKAAYLLREIGKGLAFLHERDIVHRDLKPGNIFCEADQIKIGDYGLAKHISISRHSVQSASVGTVHYMAPEIGSGNYSRGVDIYALGVILYEMLLGRVPFEGSSMGEVLLKHLTAQPELDALPAPFPAVIRKALAKDPKDRYQSVQEMIDAVFASEDIACSVRCVEPMSLTAAAMNALGRDPLRMGRLGAQGIASPTLGTGSSRPPASLLPASPIGESARTSQLLKPAEEERRASRRTGRLLLVIGGVLMVLAPTPIIAEATGAPIKGWSIASSWFFGTLSICLLTAGAIVRYQGRARSPGAKLSMPLRRSFVVPRSTILDEVLNRYFTTLGYHVAQRDPLLWVFARGKRNEWMSDDIRKYKTRATIAAYEVEDGYRVTCHLDVENPYGWFSKGELRLLDGELAGLEDLLGQVTGGSAGGAPANIRPMDAELACVP